MQFWVQQFLDAIRNEFRILKHLGSKVTAQNKDYRLSPTQRSIEELEKYIAFSLPVQVQLSIRWWWDEDFYNKEYAKWDTFTYDQFDSALDKTLDVLQEKILALTPQQWDEVITLFGKTGTRTMHIVDYVLAFLGAYRMQLFLQLKWSGLSHLSTMNVRWWVDGEMK